MKTKTENKLNICWVCDEDILEFEEFFCEVIEGKSYFIHDRPGCKEIWDEIRDKSKVCMICGKKTLNLIFFGGNTFIVHPGYCTELLRRQLGLPNKAEEQVCKSKDKQEGNNV